MRWSSFCILALLSLVALYKASAGDTGSCKEFMPKSMAQEAQTLYLAVGLLVVVAALAALVLYTIKIGQKASEPEAQPAAVLQQASMQSWMCCETLIASLLQHTAWLHAG